MEHTQVLVKPLVSEKATLLKDLSNKVVFFVHPAANKHDVKRAVENIFKVSVSEVNVVRVRPRLRKKFGRVTGKVSGYKKAYVSLAPGDKIDFFEGV